MNYYIFALPNGIRCVHRYVKSSVIQCSVTINAGSRDELAGQFGCAHFLEHMLFKGTNKRRSYHINSRLERLGGELNAFTTKEDTVIQAVVLRRDFAKAMELISDILFNSTIPEIELYKERDVILDEINSYKDSPSEQIYDDFEDLLFENSALGHNILGNKSSVSKLNRSDLVEFKNNNYTSDRIVISTSGGIKNDSTIRVISKYFCNTLNRKGSYSGEIPNMNQFTRVISKRTCQSHVVLGSGAYSQLSNKRFTLALLSNILGGPASNSLLNMILREKRGLTYNIESSYSYYSDNGIFAIYFGSDRSNYEESIELIMKELNKLKSEKLSDRKLSMAKKQFVGQLTLGAENIEQNMLNAAKNILTYNCIESNLDMYNRILNITSNDVLDVSNEIFSEISMLIYK